MCLCVDANCSPVSLTEKPSLQTRHSLDSSRTQEKETGPLWITLALQKQKGFREQQQSKEERKNHREAKLAEKQARDRESVRTTAPNTCFTCSSYKAECTLHDFQNLRIIDPFTLHELNNL